MKKRVSLDRRFLVALFLALGLAGGLPATSGQAETVASDQPLARIAFGSCARQDQPQPIWEAVVASRPQLFLFLGDNIYADTEDMDVMRSGVVILSGDRHLAELARLPADHADGVGYPLYDVTSSSLNRPSGNFTKAGTRFANEINSYRVGLTYFDTNFGAVVIDWEQPDPVIRLQVCDEAGGVVLQQRLNLSELRANRPRP